MLRRGVALNWFQLENWVYTLQLQYNSEAIIADSRHRKTEGAHCPSHHCPSHPIRKLVSRQNWTSPEGAIAKYKVGVKLRAPNCGRRVAGTELRAPNYSRRVAGAELRVPNYGHRDAGAELRGAELRGSKLRGPSCGRPSCILKFS